MALAIVQELVQQYLQSLLIEGVLNNTFGQIVAQTKSETIVEQIRTYCHDMEALISDTIECIDYYELDYSKLTRNAQDIEDKSQRIGAEYVRRASAQLIRSCQAIDKKEKLSKGIAWVKTEYFYTKEKLDTLLQMERKVIRLKNKQIGRATSSDSNI